MTLKQKREIVAKFRSGEPIQILTRQIAYQRCNSEADYLRRVAAEDIDIEIEQVLRDFMLGKFQLERKRR